MRLDEFIQLKSKQLAFYVNAFVQRQIGHAELDMFIWDLLEEWSQVTVYRNEPYSDKERVFWHLIHQISFWSKEALETDNLLSSELKICANFISDEGCFPMDCIGIRP